VVNKLLSLLEEAGTKVVAYAGQIPANPLQPNGDSLIHTLQENGCLWTGS